jgi:hypothetical protein
VLQRPEQVNVTALLPDDPPRQFQCGSVHFGRLARLGQAP